MIKAMGGTKIFVHRLTRSSVTVRIDLENGKTEFLVLSMDEAKKFAAALSGGKQKRRGHKWV